MTCFDESYGATSSVFPENIIISENTHGNTAKCDWLDIQLDQKGSFYDTVLISLHAPLFVFIQTHTILVDNKPLDFTVTCLHFSSMAGAAAF